MAKSNFHEQSKGPDSNSITNTPVRRAPRMSETNQVEVPPFKPF